MSACAIDTDRHRQVAMQFEALPAVTRKARLPPAGTAFSQELAARYASRIGAGRRPRSLTVWPCSRAHARTSAEEAEEAPARRRRGRAAALARWVRPARRGRRVLLGRSATIAPSPSTTP